MKEFFNTYFNIKNMMDEKRKYRQQMARVKALPNDYQYVFKKIQEHMWSNVTGSGYDMMELQYGLLDLFEESVANGKSVLEVTGEDVAGFVDELLKNTKTYENKWKDKMNKDIHRKIGR